MLKRQLNKLQWMALGLLMIGATTSQIGCSGSGLAAGAYTRPLLILT